MFMQFIEWAITGVNRFCRFIGNHGKQFIIGAVAGGSVLLTDVAQAAQDWGSIGSEVEAEITAVMPIALGVMGAVLAVAIGKKVLKRIAG